MTHLHNSARILFVSTRYFCFGGGGSPPAPAPAPVAPPPPTPSPPEPAEETASKIAERKRKQLAAVRYGMASTVKTSSAGDAGSVNLLLPALVGSGLKEKLGS